MHGIVAQQQAERRILGVCGHAPDGVAGVNILQVHLYPGFIKVVFDLIRYKNAYIPKANVPGCIALLALLHQVLSGSFSSHDNCVPSSLQPILQCVQEGLDGESNFWHHAEVYVIVCECGVCRNKSGITAH